MDFIDQKFVDGLLWPTWRPTSLLAYKSSYNISLQTIFEEKGSEIEAILNLQFQYSFHFIQSPNYKHRKSKNLYKKSGFQN